MSSWKLLSATCAVAVVTAVLSISGAPAAASAARGQVREVKTVAAPVYPLVAALAVGGVGAAFLLGVLQGYAEERNAQRKGSTDPKESRPLPIGEFEHVLD
jgi:phage tail tape-measure protein